MIKLTEEYKKAVLDALLENRANFTGSDADYAKQWGINKTVFSTLKKGDVEKKISDEKWIDIGMALDVTPQERKWKFVKTVVYRFIERQVLFCKAYHKGYIMVDECAIGKTYSAKYLTRTLENCFYIDASQAKTKTSFAKALAKAVGANSKGSYESIKGRIKYSMKVLRNPVIIIDEAGDMDYKTLLDIKEYYNAVDGLCGWFMMGANGLRTKLESGIEHEVNGYQEVFSRMSDVWGHIVPEDNEERIQFYRELVKSVLEPNASKGVNLDKIANQCLRSDMKKGESTGLRRAETLLIIEEQKL